MADSKSDTRTLISLDEVVKARRATQGFNSDPVPDELLTQILELALLAPSGYNLQPWRFIVVKEEEARKRLRKAAMNQPKVEEAPVVVIACADPNSWKTDIDRVIKLAKETGQIKDDKVAESMKANVSKSLSAGDNKLWASKQTMIAFTQLMLVAESFGLDTAPMEGFYEDQVKEQFEIPADLTVLALLAIGHAGKPDRPFGGRFHLSDMVSLDKFGNPYNPAS